MAGGGTRIRVEDGSGRKRGSGTRFAAGLLSVALILLAAAISRSVSTAGAPKGATGKAPSLLAVVSQRPALSFGFRNLLADVAWLDAVQVSGNLRMKRDDYDRLSDLLSTMIRFDPRFMVPYLLGGITLGESRDHSDAALDLLARGERQFPGEWLFPFYAGFLQYFSLGNPEAGGMALLRAGELPGSPGFLPMLASRMLSEGHRPATALALLGRMEEREMNPRRKAVLRERIRQVEVERDLQILEQAVGEYRTRTGAPPGRLADLVLAGVLARIPEEPYGGRYLLMPDGQVRSDRAPEGRLKVLRKP